MGRPYVPYLFLAVAGVLWGSGHPVIRYILGRGDSHMNALHIALLSTVVGLLMLSAVICFRGGGGFRRLGWNGFAVAGLSGGLQYGIYPILSYTALSYIPASLNAIIVGSSPILIALISRPLLGERLRLVGYGGMALAFTGLILLVGGYGNGTISPFGASLSALASLTASIYAVAGRYLMKNHEVLPVSLLGAALGSIILAYVVYFYSGFAALIASDFVDLGLVIYWGVAVTAGNLFFYMALKRTDSTRAGSFFFISPVAAAALSITLLGEPITATILFGMAAVLIGIRLTILGMAG